MSGQLDLVVEAQIGASSSSSDFTAVVNTLIKDADQVSTSMSVGIGQPTVTDSLGLKGARGEVILTITTSAY